MYWKYVCARKMNAQAFGIGRERKTGETWMHRDTQFRYLPCSSGNSPRNSDNLDQSVASTNPHLPGAQGKISHPSQVVRDWRHEITFSVFDSLLSQQTTQKQERRTQEKKKKRSFTRCTLPSTSVCGRTSAANSGDAQSSSELRTRMRNTHALKTHSKFHGSHVLAKKLSCCSRANRVKSFNLDHLYLKPV